MPETFKPKENKDEDLEIVRILIEHIQNPCEVETAPGQIDNIREFYLRKAEEILPTIQNKYAYVLLENIIYQYKK